MDGAVAGHQGSDITSELEDPASRQSAPPSCKDTNTASNKYPRCRNGNHSYVSPTDVIRANSLELACVLDKIKENSDSIKAAQLAAERDSQENESAAKLLIVNTLIATSNTLVIVAKDLAMKCVVRLAESKVLVAEKATIIAEVEDLATGDPAAAIEKLANFVRSLEKRFTEPSELDD
ncbi:hypothetical protein FHL15_010819 [Xylaria flabelliformis]|uniref:Uncharacterized protein n=1 Tax=Xylaria flabelliformis TaxID=2512241 RepID=A0A553HK40_9PEZI|nr:hypothetical protein FHL15_010819 [Xylaria flabelliformis]